MLTPEYLEVCTDDLIQLYEELNKSIIEMMAKQIMKSGAVTEGVRWEAERLQEAGMLREEIIAELSKNTGIIDAEVDRLFREAGVETIEADNEIYSAAGLSPTGIKQSEALTQVLRAGLEKTKGSLHNLTLTTAITTQTAYLDACDLAYMQVSTGVLSHTEAIRMAVKKAAQHGTTVRYPSGHVDQLDVAIRRATLTGLNQTCAKIQLAHASELGSNLVEVTAHMGARPEHAAWQGKVYMVEGSSAKYKNLAKATGYGTGPGLCGWNCQHSFYPFFEGVSREVYSKTELKDLDDPEYYESTQKQRYYERAVRKTRRELSGYNAAMGAATNDTDRAALKKEFDRTSVKLKEQEARLKEFCKEKGLVYDSSRVQMQYGKGTTAGFGRSVSQKAVWANRMVLQNRVPEGIIQIDSRFDVASNKITQYLLKPGGKHYSEFTDVGYSELYPLQLYRDIAAGFDVEKATDRKVDHNGAEKFSIYMELGVTKKKRFVTGWQIDAGSDKPRLITAHREG